MLVSEYTYLFQNNSLTSHHIAYKRDLHPSSTLFIFTEVPIDVRCKPRRYTISKLRPMDVTYFILISNY